MIVADETPQSPRSNLVSDEQLANMDAIFLADDTFQPERFKSVRA